MHRQRLCATAAIILPPLPDSLLECFPPFPFLNGLLLCYASWDMEGLMQFFYYFYCVCVIVALYSVRASCIQK